MRTCSKIYGIYDLNDYVQCVGTIKEVSNFLGISEHTVYLNLK